MTDENDKKTMAISGMGGLVGTALSELAAHRGWTVIPLVRDRDATGIYWSVEEKQIDAAELEGIDAVVHLAGENIADGRWDESHRWAILQSRVRGTTLVAEAIDSLADPPTAFVCASGVDYYGPRGDEWVDEDDESGEGFLAGVCRQWEASCEPATDVSRVVNTRFGMILSGQGGALQKMLTPFKFGVGGRLGTGNQYMSWVVLRDVVRAILFVIEESSLEGPVNVTSPNPVTNRAFTKALGEALNRPTVLPVPATALKLVTGSQMAEELLLSGQRVRPTRLIQAGFEFEYDSIDEALADTVG